MLADSVGLALLIVLDTLTPAERLAFVLHDMFELPFDEIAPMVDRSPKPPGSSRAGPGGGSRVPTCRLPTLTWPVSARSSMPSLQAARGGDFDGLVSVLDPDVVLREDFSPKRPLRVFRGAAAVAGRARAGALPGAEVRPALVNGAAGAVITLRGRPFGVIGFTVRHGRIVEIDGIVGAERVRRISASVLRAPGV